MKNLLAPLTIAVALSSALSSCGPVFNTTYQFTPPKSESGRACIFQCETSRSQCRQIEELRVDRCEDQSRWEQQRCEDDVYRRTGKSPKWYECGSSSCSPEYDRCDEQYRSCYQSCGGKVNTETQCVSNCDQLAPGQGR